MTPDQLAHMHARCFKTPRPWTAVEFASELNSPLSHLFSHAHGFALTRIITDEAELLTLATDPDYRRQGIAQSLMDRMHSDLEKRGVSLIFLEVAMNNLAAQDLYSDNGYNESGQRPNYFRTPNGKRIDALILAKQLT